MAGVPDLLTVEEAARLIRVGRTKAYAMAQEWRATGGRSGLPVVDFGHVLRVPRKALEQIIGAEFEDLTAGDTPQRRSEPGRSIAAIADSDPDADPLRASHDEAVTSIETRPARQSRRSRVQSPDQATLFESPVPTPRP